MKIKVLILFSCALICAFTHAQPLSCEKLIKKLEVDSKKNKSMWAHYEFSNDDYYCAGKYFAQQDLKKDIHLLKYWGFSPEYSPCKKCNYEHYGFKIQYDFDVDVYYPTKDNFFKGYNEISKAFLKAKVGDSLFQYLENIPEEYFNPSKILNTAFTKDKYSTYFNIERINDRTINIKINVDSLFKGYPELIEETIYHVTPNYNRNSKNNLTPQVFNYKQIKEVGFRLTQQPNNKYVFKIDVDFSNIKRKETYCWCEAKNQEKYHFIIPIILN